MNWCSSYDRGSKTGFSKVFHSAIIHTIFDLLEIYSVTIPIRRRKVFIILLLGFDSQTGCGFRARLIIILLLGFDSQTGCGFRARLIIILKDLTPVCALGASSNHVSTCWLWSILRALAPTRQISKRALTCNNGATKVSGIDLFELLRALACCGFLFWAIFSGYIAFVISRLFVICQGECYTRVLSRTQGPNNGKNLIISGPKDFLLRQRTTNPIE